MTDRKSRRSSATIFLVLLLLVLVRLAITGRDPVRETGFGMAAVSGDGSCADHFYRGKAPRLTDPKLQGPHDDTLCYREYAVYHSGKSRCPLWSAEHLTASRIRAAHHLRRTNAFHEEERVNFLYRASLGDYLHSEYDRGHMTPSGDCGTKEGQKESFSLANMVPQAPELNRGIWEGYEEAVREQAKTSGEIYVITGPLYEGTKLSSVGRIPVPTSVYKVVADPRVKAAVAVVCTNENAPSCKTESLPTFTKRAGIDFFPGTQFTEELTLPEAVPYRERHRRSSL